jgi:hypothetical protein
MIKHGLLLVVLGLFALLRYGTTAQHPTPPPPSQPAAATESSAAAGQKPAGAPPAEAHYILTPEKRAKAIAYSRAQYVLYLASIALSLAIYGFLWRIGFAVVLRQWVRRVSARHFVRYVLFAPLFLTAVRVLEFPLDYYWGFTLEHRYDLSTQKTWKTLIPIPSFASGCTPTRRSRSAFDSPPATDHGRRASHSNLCP